MGRLPDIETGAVAARPGATPFARLALAAIACLFTANCMVGPMARMVDPKYGVAASPRVVEEGQPVPRGGGVYRVGNAYTIAGRTYIPEENPNYSAEGVASWYGSDFHGRRTANGEVFDMHSISAAHPTLPIPSYVRVTHLSNRRSLIVRINDRGPFKDNRIIDLSKRSADLLGFKGNGLARVRVEYVGRASLDGSDDRTLLATLRHDGRPAPAPSAVMVASTGGPFVPVAQDVMPERRAMQMPVAQVPTPESRPFALGRNPAAPAEQDPPYRPVQTASAGALPARPATFQPDRARDRDFATPAAFTPAVISGRGLY